MVSLLRKMRKNCFAIESFPERLFTTVGCHPTRCLEFDENPTTYLTELKKTIESGSKKVVAVGECGLDYDRIQFCSKDIQKKLYYQNVLCKSFEM
jgi:TatD DNase family protein